MVPIFSNSFFFPFFWFFFRQLFWTVIRGFCFFSWGNFGVLVLVLVFLLFLLLFGLGFKVLVCEVFFVLERYFEVDCHGVDHDTQSF